MSNRFYTAVLGANGALEVTEGAADVGASPFSFRLTYDATGMTKHDAIKGIKAIQFYITQDTWPPV